jgi:hypothetical protein
LDLLSAYDKTRIGHCGGVVPLQNGKKETSRGGGTGNTEAPASPERVNVRWMRAMSECETTGSSGKLTGNRSRRAGLKKRADVAVGERKTGRKKRRAGQKEDAARTAIKEKDQGCTVRLFGTNSLKKGAV